MIVSCHNLPMTQPLRWALIGASDIAATRLIPAINGVGDTITAVQSGSQDWAAAYAATHTIDFWTTSVDELLSRVDVDAVYVSSTNEKHHDQVVAAAAAGKHVLAEKPLALTVDDARAMVAACEHAGVVMATNHHLPASPTHRAMKALVADGAIGQVRAVHVNHSVGLPQHLQGWRVDDPIGGGVAYDVFVHDMAAVRALIGGQALRVYAAERTGAAVPQSLMTVVNWADDVIVQTHDSYDNYHLPTWLEILGTQGAIRSTGCMTGDPIGEVQLFKDHQLTDIEVGPRDDLYVTTVRAFDRAVREGTAPLVTGWDGVCSLAAVEAAQAALSSGCGAEVQQIL